MGSLRKHYLLTDLGGRDATKEFLDIRHTNAAVNMLRDYIIGRVLSDEELQVLTTLCSTKSVPRLTRRSTCLVKMLPMDIIKSIASTGGYCS